MKVYDRKLTDEQLERELQRWVNGLPVEQPEDELLYDIIVCHMLGVPPEQGGFHDQPAEWIHWSLKFNELVGMHNYQIQKQHYN